MKFIFSGGWSYGNIGDEVIAASTIFLADKYCVGCEKIFTAYDTEDFYREHDRKAVSSVHKIICEHNLENDNLDDILSKNVWKEYEELFQENTVFVMSGGGYFGGSWKSQVLSRIIEIEIAKRCGAKVILLGQSIGPIYGEFKKDVIRVLNKADYIAVRDTSSEKLLRQLIGKEVDVYPDIAIVVSDFIEGMEKEHCINIMPAAYSEYTGINAKKDRSPLLLKLNRWISPGAIIYRRTYKKIVKYIANELQYKIQFVMSTNWSWDIKFMRKLSEQISNCEYKTFENCSSIELCKILSSGDVILSSKMHPIIISSSYNIPSIGISYNFKVEDFMESIGRKKFCFNVDHFYYKKAIKKINECLNDSDFSAENKKREVYDMINKIESLIKKEK